MSACITIGDKYFPYSSISFYVKQSCDSFEHFHGAVLQHFHPIVDNFFVTRLYFLEFWIYSKIEHKVQKFTIYQLR